MSDPIPGVIVDAVAEPVIVVRAWRVAVASVLVAIAFAVLAACLAASGCTSAQTGKPRTAAEVVVEFRKIGHEAAVAYCSSHTALEPLIVVAEGHWPLLTVPNATANLFCAAVQHAEQTAPVRPYAWRIDPNGFDAIAPPQS